MPGPWHPDCFAVGGERDPVLQWGALVSGQLTQIVLRRPTEVQGDVEPESYRTWWHPPTERKRKHSGGDPPAAKKHASDTEEDDNYGPRS